MTFCVICFKEDYQVFPSRVQFAWDAIIEEIQEKAPARFHSTASVPVVHNMEAKYPKFGWHMT